MTMVFSLQLVVNVWQGNYKLFKKNVRIKLYDESDRSVRFVGSYFMISGNPTRPLRSWR